MREVHNISFQVCGSELMAFILESVEIKRLWPLYNRSQKGFEQAYGLYLFEDGRGFSRLVIEKKKKHLQPLYTFNILLEGHTMLKKLIAEFSLCSRLCFIDSSVGPILPDVEQLNAAAYNQRVGKALNYLKESLPSFAVVEDAPLLQKEKKGIILMENGRFFGMGYMPANISISSIADIKPHITPYPENGYIRGLVYQYAIKYPERKRELA